jgi:peptidoglycan hydrolase-like protein with peptidoglycan-binding domain
VSASAHAPAGTRRIQQGDGRKRARAFGALFGWKSGATGDAVKRLERALRRTPDLGLTVDSAFGPQVETAVKQFQQGAE